MIECDELGPHDHDDERLPPWFHAWLRGERRHAPPMRSWKARRDLLTPFGTVGGAGWTAQQRASHRNRVAAGGVP